MLKLLEKIFGTKQAREIKKMAPFIKEINSFYEEYKEKPDEWFKEKTLEFKERLKEGESLDDIMTEAFGVVKAATYRLLGRKWLVRGYEIEWNMVPFDVQLIGAIVLHQGKIAEMRTGEGKTLVATMPLYLNALTGRGVHLVTVNDYLATRDKEWMGPLYEFLGLSVGVIQNSMETDERRSEYNKDITYGTNSEFGFDYLRDNMVLEYKDKVQRGHYYAIIDEVDSILIDEARTPLIISGPVAARERGFGQLKPYVQRLYRQQSILVNRIVDKAEKLLEEDKEMEAAKLLLIARRGSPKHKRFLRLQERQGMKRMIDDIELKYMKNKNMEEIDEELFYVIDEKQHVIDLTEKGREFVSPNDPDLFVLPDLSQEIHAVDTDTSLSPQKKLEMKEEIYEKYGRKNEMLHNLYALLRAYTLFEKDVDYIIQNGQVVIVDEFTGRLMPGRRYSDGLHQALEAKEGVRVREETQELAKITIQNYFRMYDKLSGMTGTAATEANEFWQIYKLEVVEIPTNKPVRRIDYSDLVYKSKREKYNAVIEEVIKWHKRGRPILVGTTSVDVSEVLSRMLKRKKINHHVLNAKHHQKEAEIVAKAGERGAVTIATNMAGRGTDIKLGKDVVRCSECYILNEEALKDAEKKKLADECIKEVPCGLYIIGTERHESRRIDNQLRGRSGRQGDPGSSRFYVSLEDDLMRIFGADKLSDSFDKYREGEGQPIRHALMSRFLETAQKRVENRNFEIRKRLIEYDDVINKQREVVYEIRNEILKEGALDGIFVDNIEFIVDNIIYTHAQSRYPEEWNWEGIKFEMRKVFLADLSLDADVKKMEKGDLKKILFNIGKDMYEKRKSLIGEELLRPFQKYILLSTLDNKWRELLKSIKEVEEGIQLRAYGQKDPLIEYKKEAYNMFQEIMDEFKTESVRIFFWSRPRMQPVKREEPKKDKKKKKEETPEPQVKKPKKKRKKKKKEVKVIDDNSNPSKFFNTGS